MTDEETLYFKKILNEYADANDRLRQRNLESYQYYFNTYVRLQNELENLKHMIPDAYFQAIMGIIETMKSGIAGLEIKHDAERKAVLDLGINLKQQLESKNTPV